MRVAIIGSRTFQNYAYLKNCVENHSGLNGLSHIVSGGAQGADSLGHQYAKEMGLPITIYFPNWAVHKRGAGFVRNRLIMKNCDIVAAFWDGSSKGTKHSIDLAREFGIKTIIFHL